jgi:predicted transcriptional regulator
MGTRCLALTRRSSKKLRATASSRKSHLIVQVQKRRLRISPGKAIRAEAMLLEGHSQREICRKLHLSHHSVRKIIRSEDFQNFIKEMRERLFGIVPVAMESFRAGVATDPRLAYVFLKDLRIIPDGETMRNLMNPEPPQMTSEEQLEQRQIRLMASVMHERNRVFNVPLPDDMEQALQEADATDAKMQRC